jgi:two-component system sensor histidine kinase VicK
VSDYASISLMNARLFRAIDERAAFLQKAVEKAQESDRVKNDIIQNVSQELFAPLTAAKEYIDSFVEGDLGKYRPNQLEAMLIAQQKLQRTVEIVDAMSMMHETAAPKALIKVNMNDMVNQAVGRFQKHARKNDVVIQAELPGDPALAHADPDQIEMVFDALLSNAVKFSPNGGQVVVNLELDRNKHPHVSVQDTGIGISKKHLNHVFDRFFQIEGSGGRKVGGLGVGLALVKDIVTAHGGKVWAESKLEAGSVFHFTLLPPD